jgi:adenylosuccinate lyase
MTRAHRDRRAGALLKSRAARLRELTCQMKRLGLPNAQETARQARLDIVADLAQLGGEVYKIAADLIDLSDTSAEGLEAKNSLIEAAKRVLPWTEK